MDLFDWGDEPTGSVKRKQKHLHEQWKRVSQRARKPKRTLEATLPPWERGGVHGGFQTLPKREEHPEEQKGCLPVLLGGGLEKTTGKPKHFVDDVLSDEHSRLPRVHLGNVPCQPFSTEGKGLGTEDPTNGAVITGIVGTVDGSGGDAGSVDGIVAQSSGQCS